MTPSTQLSPAPAAARRALLAASVAAAALGWAIRADALPTGGSVESGSAGIVTGGKQVDVNQSSQRAVIDWTTFNLAADEKVAFNQAQGATAITFNRVSSDSLTTILGSVSAPGGVWIFSPAGLIIGPSARINVGSFVASTGDLPDSLRFCSNCDGSGPGPILTTNTIEMAGATADIDVQTGAQINAADGFAVFNATHITQNGAVTATDGVAYILADDTSITISEANDSGPSQQLLSVDVSNAGNADAALTHGGSTKGGWVGVIAPPIDTSETEDGFAGVINLGGVVQATGIAPFQADSTAVALVGLDGFPGTPFAGINASFNVDASGGKITADQGGVYLSGAQVAVGDVTAQQSLLVGASGDVFVEGNTKVVGQGAVSSLNATFDGDTTVDGGLSVDTGNLTVASGVTVSSKRFVDLTASQALTLDANAAVRADSDNTGGDSLVAFGKSVAADPSSVMSGGAGDLFVTGRGGPVSLGSTSGGVIDIESIDGEGSPGGDVTVGGLMTASGSVFLSSEVGSVNVNAGVTSAGPVEIDADQAITVAAGVTVRSDSGGTGAGGVIMDAGTDLNADATSAIIAGKAGAAPTSTVDLTGPDTMALGQVAGTDVTLTTGGDLTLDGNVTATQTLTVDPANIFINADLTVGGDINLTAGFDIAVNTGVKVTAGGSVDLEAGDTISLAANSVVRADSANAGGSVFIEAPTIDADPSSLIAAGPIAGPPGGAVTVYADGGDLKAGGVSGTAVLLEARGPQSNGGGGDSGDGPPPPPPPPPLPGGDLIIGGPVTGTSSVTGLSDFGVVAVNANVTGGSIDIEANTDLTVAGGVNVMADKAGLGGDLFLGAGGDITAAPTSNLQGGASAAAPTGGVLVSADGDIAVGKVSGTTVELTTGGSVETDGAVFGSQSVLIDPLNVDINADMTSGGTIDITADNAVTIAPGVLLAAADHTFITATTISAGTGATIQSDSDGNGAGAVDLEADSIAASGASVIGGKTSPTGAVTINAANGAIDVGAVKGSAVVLTASDAITLFGAQTAGVSYSATSAGAGIEAKAGITSGGGIDLNAPTTIALDDGAGLAGGGAVNVKAAVITVGAGASVQSDSGGLGGPRGVTLVATGGDLTVDPTSSVFAGGSAAAPTAPVTLTSDLGKLGLGPVAGSNVTLTSAGDLSLGAGILATGNLAATSTAGRIDIIGDLTAGADMDLKAKTTLAASANRTVKAGGHLNAQAATITLAAGDSFQADSAGKGAGTGVNLHAAGDLTADPTSRVFAGATAGAPTAAVTLTSDTGALGLGQVAGTNVTLSSAKDLTLGAGVLATGALSATSTGGQIAVADNLASGGDMDLTAKTSLGVAANKALKAGGHLNATAASITLAAGDTAQSDSGGLGGARGLNLHATGAIAADPTSQVFAGGAITAPTAAVTLTSDNAGVSAGRMAGTAVTVTAPGDVTLGGAVLASNSITVDPANIAVNANLTSGGTIDLTATKTVTVATGVAVSAADHLHVTAASIGIAAGDLVQSDSDGDGAGDLSLHATAGDVTVGAGGQILGGKALANGTAAVAVTSDTGALTLGPVGGKDVTLSSAADLTLTGAIQATGALSATSTAGAVAVQDNVSSGADMDLSAKTSLTVAANKTVKAGGHLSGSAGTVTLAAGDVLQSDSGGAGGHALTLTSSGAFTADPTSALIAGAKASTPTSAISANAGGNATFGQVSGTAVTLTAAGDTTLGGAVFGSQSVFVDPGNLHVAANVSSGGSIALIADAGGALTIDPNVTVTSSGGPVFLTAGQDISLGAGAQVSGGAMDVVAGGTLHLASGSGLTTTGTSAAPSWPILPATVAPAINGGVPNFSGMNIAAAGFDLQGSVTAGPATARDDIYIQVLGTPTLVSVGGADTTGGGVRLSNAAISRMSGRNLVIMAGAGEGAGSNANIQVDDLTIDSSHLSGLGLGTSSDRTVNVAGQVSVAGSSPVDLHIGFTRNLPVTRTDPNGGQTALQGFIPGEIDVTGGLGAANAPLHATVLLARNNIFMGSTAFIAAAKADPNFNAVEASPNYVVDYGHVLVASHDLELGAQGRIIQQNTKGAFRYAGLVIDSPATGHALTAAPASLEGRTIGTGSGAWTAHYALGPTAIDVFGVVTRGDGSQATTVDAALEPNLADPAINLRASYRINTCVFASHCVAAQPPLVQFASYPPGYVPLPPPDTGDDLQVDDTNDKDRQNNGVPITESGNGDLWRFPSGPPTQ